MSESREELESRIAAYIDGELPAAEAARLEVFLANTDPALAEQVIGMLADKHRLRSLEPARAPVDLSARIMEQVERASLLNGTEHFASHRRWWQTRAAIAAAVFLVVGGFTYLLLNTIQQPKSPWGDVASNDHSGKAKDVLPATPGTPEMEKMGPVAVAPVVVPSAPGSTVAPAPAATTPPAMRSKAGVDRDTLRIAKGEVADDLTAPREMGKHAANDFGGSRNLKIAPNAPVTGNDATLSDNVQSQLARNRIAIKAKDAEAAQLGFVQTASATKAIDRLAKNVNGADAEPVVLTLVARNNADSARLQTLLADFVAQYPDSAKMQIVAQDRFRNSSKANQQLDEQRPNAAGAREPNAGNNPNPANISNNNYDNGANVTNGNTANNDGGYRFYNDRQRNFESDSNYGQMATQQQPVVRQSAARQQAGTPAETPYRVVLRADQLATLAKEFQVRTVSRGDLAYMVAPANNDAPADISRQMDSADKSLTQRKEEAAGFASANSAPTTLPAPAASPQDLPLEAQQKPTQTADQWIECVITMEPEGAGQAATPALNNSAPPASAAKYGLEGAVRDFRLRLAGYTS